MIFTKTAQELNAIMEERLRQDTSLNYFDDGSIVKTLLSVINEQIEHYYERLDFNSTMAFVSHAQGAFLDMLGELLDCQRIVNEEDDNYRYRITNQVYTATGANETSVRLRCLSVSNVKNVFLVPYVKGAGSFVVYVDVENRNQEEQTIQAVQEVIDEVKAFGIHAQAVLPSHIRVDLRGRVAFRHEVSTGQKRAITQECIQVVRQYIDNLEIAEDLIIAQIYYHVLNTHTSIENFELQGLTVNSKPVIIADRVANWDQQFYAGLIDIN